MHYYALTRNLFLLGEGRQTFINIKSIQNCSLEEVVRKYPNKQTLVLNM